MTLLGRRKISGSFAAPVIAKPVRTKLTLAATATLVLVATSAVVSPSAAQVAGNVTLTFEPGVNGYDGVVDTFIMENNPDATQSAQTWVEWDTDDPSGSGNSNFGLIRFDNIFGAGVNQVPTGATIVSATFTYVVNNTGGAGDVNQVSIDWASDVTYSGFGAEAGVQTDDYDASLGTAAGGVTGEQTLDVTSSVVTWAADPATNFGWIFRPTATDGVEFRSSEYATTSERPRLEVVYSTDPVNQPPDLPTLISPSDGAVDVSGSPPLEVSVSDPDGDELTVTFFGRAAETVAGDDFTIIAMPDTQHYTDNGGANSANFDAQTQWIADNQNARNIVFVTGLGDIVQNGDTSDAEWQIADFAYSLIEDATSPTYGVPYGLAVGNHDQQPVGGGSTASTTKYNEYFGESRFSGRVYYGGHHGSNNDNHYQLFSGGGMDFIIIHLEYDTTPEQDVLDWADSLLTTYADRRAIVTAHYFINSGNPASFGAQGQATYSSLSDHENLFLMLSGHIHGEGRRQDTAINGNVVNSLLSDYQDYPNGGDGFLRIMTFSPANDTIQIETYSPVLSQFESDDSSEFVLNYEMDSGTPYENLGSDTVSSGSDASAPSDALNADNTEYEWYVTVDDGVNVTNGDTWSFTTGTVGSGNAAPDTTLTATPLDPTTSDAADFEFTGTDDLTIPSNLSFECQLDGAGFAACTSPTNYTGLGTGQHTFDVRAIDEENNIDLSPASFSWSVTEEPPVATDDNASTDEDTAVVVDVLSNDSANSVSVSDVTQPANGVAVNQDTDVEYLPNANFCGNDNFDYTASNGSGGSDTATVNVTVNCINDLPLADDQSVATQIGIAVDVTLTATDDDGDSLTFEVVDAPTGGVLSGTAPNLSYNPNVGFEGTDSFTFRANDGSEDSNVATVSITVDLTVPAGPPVAILDDWVVDGSYATQDAIFNVSAGTDRIVLVALSAEKNQNGPMSVASVMLGDQILTEVFDFTVGGSTAYHNLNWVGYLLESEIAARSGSELTISYSNAPSDPFDSPKIYYASFENVDQLAPIADSASNSSSNASSLQLTQALVAGDSDKIVGFAVLGQHYAPGLSTAGYTEEAESIGATNGHASAIYHRTATTDVIENPTFTSSTSTRMAVSGVVLNAAN